MRFFAGFALALFAVLPASAQVLNPPIALGSDLGPDYTVAALPTCNTAIAKRTAWVTDLMGLPNGDRAICDGANWKPLRPLAVQSMTSATMTVSALTNAPTIIMTGTIATGAQHSITLSTTRAYPGARICIVRKSTGLGSMLVAVVGQLLSLNSWACFEYNGTAWEQTMSGGLL